MSRHRHIPMRSAIYEGGSATPPRVTMHVTVLVVVVAIAQPVTPPLPSGVVSLIDAVLLDGSCLTSTIPADQPASVPLGGLNPAKLALPKAGAADSDADDKCPW